MTKIPHDHLSTHEAAPDLGSLVAPLFRWHGKDIYPWFGAEGDDGGDTDPGGAPDDDDEDTGGEGDKGKDGDRPVTRDEFEQIRRQLSEADKRKAAAEKKLKEIEDGKKDELTKATERAAELEKVNAAQLAEMADMRLQNAFLTADSGITWHDPGDALALAERRGYLTEVVADDGKVDSKKLAAKLRELAKASPHLVKTGSEGGSNDGKGSDDGKGSAGAPTGGKVGGGKGKMKEEDTKKVLTKYGNLLR